MSMFFYQLRKLTKLAYRYRGFARIAEIIRKHYASSARVLLIDDFDNNLSFYCALDEHMGSQIFWRGSYSGNQLAVLDRLLKPEMVFVDVGANHGEFTVYTGKRLVNGKVFAFEPVSTLFRKLECNVRINFLNNVTMIQKGLGNVNHQAIMYTAEARFNDGTRHEGLPTLYPTNDRPKFYENVELVRLDDLVEKQTIPHVDVMKIDVEGAELAALQGARNTIKRFRPIILLEVNDVTSQAAGYDPSALFDYLGEFGYRFELILDEGRTKPISSGQLNAFQNVVCWPEN